jgi:iron-sulfur cluster repair protein YtfE (RIC family)
MSDVAVPTRPDTRDMLAVHQVFRSALAAAPRIVGGASRADAPHAANVASYYANVLAFLHVHHEGEDELVWPKLLERCPAEAERVQEIADQHHAVTVLLASAGAELAEWADEPNADHGAKLAGALVLLGNELTNHLDQEEAFVLPLAAEHMTVEEWAELPAHGMKHFSGDKVWVLLGLLFEAMPPGQPELTLAHMPPPVAEFWISQGQAMFDTFIADVRR